ncbi:hypothetical protein TrST_g5879 [Triparma strigata]|uniref:Uncharacterized protein n=1 Tax=Triparma strigata TaxID=1606541 RepID=A0A9W7BCP4_9STRA|nr:hypothetical protein TrST_g5879 [Triparma strigata]
MDTSPLNPHSIKALHELTLFVSSTLSKSSPSTPSLSLSQAQTLLKDWSVHVRQRKTGASAGGVDCYYIGPGGERYRSRLEVCRALAGKGGERGGREIYGKVPRSREGAMAEARNRLGEVFKQNGGVVGGARVWELGNIWKEGSGEYRLESEGVLFERFEFDYERGKVGRFICKTAKEPESNKLIYSVTFGDGVDMFHENDFAPSIYFYNRPTDAEVTASTWICPNGHIKLTKNPMLAALEKQRGKSPDDESSSSSVEPPRLRRTVPPPTPSEVDSESSTPVPGSTIKIKFTCGWFSATVLSSSPTSGKDGSTEKWDVNVEFEDGWKDHLEVEEGYPKRDTWFFGVGSATSEYRKKRKEDRKKFEEMIEEERERVEKLKLKTTTVEGGSAVEVWGKVLVEMKVLEEGAVETAVNKLKNYRELNPATPPPPNTEIEPPTEKENALQQELTTLKSAHSVAFQKTDTYANKNEGRLSRILSAIVKGTSAEPSALPIPPSHSALSCLNLVDTFYPPSVHRLLEGLPGSYACSSYNYIETLHAQGDALTVESNRKKARDAERNLTGQFENMEKEWSSKRKGLKRKLKEVEWDSKKKSKVEDQLKNRQKREEDRLGRLEGTVKEKLTREAGRERLKVVKHIVRTVSASALTVRNHAAMMCKDEGRDVKALGRVVSPIKGGEVEKDLPPVWECEYDQDILRIWEFLTVFHRPLTINPRVIPSLSAIQSAVSIVDVVPKTEVDFSKRSKAIQLLTNLAANFCKPLSGEVKNLLVTAEKQKQNQEMMADSIIPVNEFTWEEIARLAVLNKAFDELGIVKTEQTYAFRGQGGGIFSVVKKLERDLKTGKLIYQALADEAKKESMGLGEKKVKEEREERKVESKASNDAKNKNIKVGESGKVSVTIRAPSTPSCNSPQDWKFHLHCIKTMSTNSGGPIKTAITQAIGLLYSSDHPKKEQYTTRLRASISDAIYKGNASGPTKNIALKLLSEEEGENFNNGLQEEDDEVRGRGEEVKALFNFKGVVGQGSGATPEKQNVEEEGKQDKEAARIAMLRGGKRQTSFVAGPLGKVLTLRELDNLSAEREKYVRKSRKFMKKRDDESEDEDDDDDDDDEKEGEDEKEKKVIGGRGSTFIRINEEGNCEVIPGEHDGLVPIAQTTYVVNGNVEGYTPLDQARFPKIAREFPQNKWIVLRNYDGHYKICHESEPTHIYGSLGLAREFMATLPEEECGKFGEPPFIPRQPGEEPDPNKPRIIMKPKPLASAEGPKSPFPKTAFDEFCGDVLSAPEAIRRCLAIVRTLCLMGASDKFITPISPKDVPTYYEKVLRPVCLMDIGNRLLAEARADEPDEEKAVKTMVDDMHLLVNNTYCFNVVGSVTLNNMDKVATTFERLLFDWLLAPTLPLLGELNDEICYSQGKDPSDDTEPVLICDKCDAKYNMTRLVPPLDRIPKNEWFCPGCVENRCWFNVDPRIGKSVVKHEAGGEEIRAKITGCNVMDARLSYNVAYSNKNGTSIVDQWSLEDVDKQLKDLPKVRFPDAVCRSLGYNHGGRDHGVLQQLLPPNADPRYSVKAAEASATSSSFLEAINGVITMNTKAEDRKGKDWVEIFKLLASQCTNAAEVSAEIEAFELFSKQQYQTHAGGGPNVDAAELFRMQHEKEFAGDTRPKEVQVVEVKVDEDAMQVDPVVAVEGVEVVGEAGAGDVVAGVVVEDATMTDVGDAGVSAEVVEGLVQPTITSSFLTPEAIAAAEKKKEREEQLAVRHKRSKKREDAFTAHTSSLQIKRALGSKEAATVLPILSSTLAEPDISGIVCPDLRCRFCGQTDIQLCAPLVRFPTEDEWSENFKHASCNRQCRAIAEGKEGKLASVTIKVGGKLISIEADEPMKETMDMVPDKGMREFMPWSAESFQEELAMRDEEKVPFLTGGLIAHENCAIAVHTMRKNRMRSEHKDRYLKQLEEQCMRDCGRSVPLGEDSVGRLYWKLSSDNNALVVHDRPKDRFVRYTTGASIAAVIVALGEADPAKELRRLYPQSAKMVEDRSWVGILQGDDEEGTLTDDEGDVEGGVGFDMMMDEGEDDAFQPREAGVGTGRAKKKGKTVDKGNSVLVVSPSGSQYWDAKIVETARSEDGGGEIVGYRVHYKKWSSRFDEWVAPSRVLVKDKENLEMQAELLEGVRANSSSQPATLQSLDRINAVKHLNAPGRARGDAKPHPLEVALKVRDPNSSLEKQLAKLRATLLVIEAAMPEGAVRSEGKKASWIPSIAAQWRKNVEAADGPSALMRCVICLECALDSEWLREASLKIIANNPTHSKALQAANLSSVAIRIYLLDRGIKFGAKMGSDQKIFKRGYF